LKSPTAAQQLAAFIARFSPEIAKLARSVRATMRKRLPRAIEMVYDNHYALVIGYSPTERPSDAILSIVVAPDHVTVCLLFGKHLPDSTGFLQGGGNRVRHFRLDARGTMLGTPAVRAVIDEAVKFSDVPFKGKHQLVIRAIAKKPRPRR
jgi:hypothetical protein